MLARRFVSVLVGLVIVAGPVAAASGVSVTRAQYRHEIDEEGGVRAEVVLSVLNEADTALTRLSLLVAVMPERVRDIRVEGPGGAIEATAVPQDGSTLLEFALPVPLRRGETASLEIHYRVLDCVRRTGDSFTATAPNALLAAMGKGRKAFTYEVTLPPGMFLKWTVPAGGRMLDQNGKRVVTYATDYPGSAFTVTYAPRAGGVSELTLIYLVFFGLLLGLAAVLMKAGVWQAYFPRSGKASDRGAARGSDRDTG